MNDLQTELTTTKPRSNSPAQSIANFLQNPKVMKQMQMALPKGMTPDRLARIALSTIRTNPKLLQCRVESLMSCVMECAALGLMPGPLGHMYLVPYGKECKNIIGYKGLVELARRSGEISTIQAQAVYEHDEFDYEYGIDQKLKHIPNLKDRGALKVFYAYAKLKDGGTQFEVMTKEDVDGIRKRSKAGSSGPWETDYEEMGKKTVLKRLCKLLPISTDAHEAVAKDEQSEYGEPNVEVNVGELPDIEETLDA